MNNDWNPGHSTNKGYPYDTILSKETFPNRPDVWLDRESKQIAMRVNAEHFPQNPKWPKKRTPVESFLMARLFDYSEALRQAEGQIEDILSEHPFFPSEFGFEETLKHEYGEAPMRIFVSMVDGNFSLFRKAGDPNDVNWNPSMWTLLKKKIVDGHTVFQEIDVILPCRRIAFATLYALGVKFPKVKTDEKVNPEVNLKPQKGFRTFKLNFKRDPIDRDFDITVHKDCNEKDAISKLMFELSTGTHIDCFVEDPKFEEITVVTQSQRLKPQRT